MIFSSSHKGMTMEWSSEDIYRTIEIASYMYQLTKLLVSLSQEIELAHKEDKNES